MPQTAFQKKLSGTLVDTPVEILRGILGMDPQESSNMPTGTKPSFGQMGLPGKANVLAQGAMLGLPFLKNLGKVVKPAEEALSAGEQLHMPLDRPDLVIPGQEAAYNSRFPSTQRPETSIMKAIAEHQGMGQEMPEATFLGHSPSGPLFNIKGGPSNLSTVTMDTLKKLGLKVPNFPADTGQRLSGDVIRKMMMEKKR